MEWDQGSGTPGGGPAQVPEQQYGGQYYYGAHQEYRQPPARGPRGRRKNGSGTLRTAVTAAVSAVIASLLVLLAMPAVFGVNPIDLVRGKLRNSARVATTGKTVSDVKVVSPTGGATDVTTVAQKVTPSVVNIDVRIASRQQSMFYQTEPQEGTGSGVIYSDDGYIITNNHVVEGAQTIAVTLATGEELEGDVVGTDPENDIAVVKIDKSGLQPIVMGNSDELVVGQLVVAVGSPLGFEKTVTAGIVSALHRNVPATDETTGQATVLTDLIQTDTAINPGNSGGALCDAGATLIGVNTLIASQSGGSEGIGFAIPSDTVRQVADDLIAGRAVAHPYVGIYGQTLSESSGTVSDAAVDQGVYVTRVMSGSPAEKAGIKAGDIIVEAGGQTVKSMNDLVASVRGAGVGGELSVTYYRGGEKKTTTMTVTEKPTVSM